MLQYFKFFFFLSVLGEGLLLAIDKKDVRISRDWLGDRWINIEAKPDIVSVISAPLSSSGTKPSMSSSIEEDPASAKLIISEEENQNPNGTASTDSDDPPKEPDQVNREKSPSLRDNVNDGDDGVNADDTCNNVDSFKANDDDANKDDKGHDDTKDADGSKGDIIKKLETSRQSCKAAAEMTEVTA